MKRAIFLILGQFLMIAVVGAGAMTVSAESVGTVNIPPTAGFLQFNNLVVESVSSTTAPSEIVANSGLMAPQPMVGTTGNGSAATGQTNASAQICFQFESQSSASAQSVMCPTPPVIKGGPSYRIKISASTELLLLDRTVATLADFAVGDQINVFGYYNSDGSIQAYLVRDLSRPTVAETIQLNNVTLVSVSGTSLPVTLAVTQMQGAPCYSFNSGSKAPYACPLGLSSFSANNATQNVQVPQSLMPAWTMLRKYAVTVDAQTIILDSNRTQLSLSSLKTGDQLNVYGETSDNGQTVTADIVRDLSLPVAVSAYTGEVTQVNADGSFIIQTNNGQTITAQDPIKAGVTVTLRGLLDNTQNVLSEISQILIGPTTIPVTNSQ